MWSKYILKISKKTPCYWCWFRELAFLSRLLCHVLVFSEAIGRSAFAWRNESLSSHQLHFMCDDDVYNPELVFNVIKLEIPRTLLREKWPLKMTTQSRKKWRSFHMTLKNLDHPPHCLDYIYISLLIHSFFPRRCWIFRSAVKVLK